MVNDTVRNVLISGVVLLMTIVFVPIIANGMAGAEADSRVINETEVLDPALGEDWTQTSSSGEFETRSQHFMYTFGDKIYLGGGADSDGNVDMADIWSSTDGVTWTLEADPSDIGNLTAPVVLEFNGSVYVIGGSTTNNNNGITDKVLKSDDGVNFTHVGNLTFPIWSQGGVVNDGRMYIAGGEDANGTFRNDVWSSADGITWTEETSDAEWRGRSLDFLTTLNGSLYVIMGLGDCDETPIGTCEDVWKSSDGGATWTQQNNVSFTPKLATEIHEYNDGLGNDKVLVVGGHNDDGTFTTSSEVWVTADMNEWNLISNESFTSRRFHGSTQKDDTLFITGGDTSLIAGTKSNDTWASTEVAGIDGTDLTPSSLTAAFVVGNTTPLLAIVVIIGFLVVRLKKAFLG